MKLFTISFTGKRAQAFFESLRRASVRRVIDVRLNNTSQLSGFSKQDDLKYFLREIADIDYIHVTDFAPTKEMLKVYQTEGRDWATYAAAFQQLIADRRIETTLDERDLQDACLLCSEHLPQHCHRRLVAEYLQRYCKAVSIEHLT